MTTYKINLRASAGLLAICGVASPAIAAECLSGLKPALVSGGFTGSVDCQHDQLSVQEVGQVRTARHAFSIYDYRYKLAPVCSDCAIHGGQRIIFMDHGRYMGQYKSDFVRVTIRHGNLVLIPTDPASGRPVIVRFTQHGPPKQLWVDGELIGFGR